MTTASTTTIRCARRDDAEIITDIAFRSKASWGYNDDFMEAARQELTHTAEDIANPENHYFCACQGERLVGFAALIPYDKYRLELEAIFIDPANHRQGIGRLLMNRVVDEAQTLGYAAIIIQSDPFAAPFYQRLGAKQIGERESGSIPGRYLPLFELEIGEE